MTSFQEALAATRNPDRRSCVISKLSDTLDPQVSADFHEALAQPDADVSHLSRALAHLTGQRVNRTSMTRHRLGECGCGSR